MRSRELERLLETADELVEARDRLRRAEELEERIGRERDAERRAPEIAEAAAARRNAIEPIARELEAQWVSQGPLVSQWQRAVELADLAEGSGADATEYRAEVDEARRRVEAARVGTRDQLAQLEGEREKLMDIALEAPFDVPSAAPVHDDSRPEAGRRDALSLMEFADRIEHIAGREQVRAAKAAADAEAERAELGDRDELAARVDELQGGLPEVVEVPSSAPPSASRRLHRAGIRVSNGGS
ncbi:MAG: hypothetical protein QOJ13_489 [Gaiellales bacterium]|nr:hypothetical protein [Gaiellales bacterium]